MPDFARYSQVKRTQVYITAAVLAAALPILFFLLSDRRLNFYDGGLSLSLSLRVLRGDVPHRDFYYPYGPIQPYLFAGLFRMFGIGLLPVACLEMVMKAATAAVAYFVVRGVSSQRTALIVGVTVGLVLAGVGYPSPAMDVLGPVIAAIFVSGPALSAPLYARRSVVYGLLCGVITLFRYEQGPMMLALYAAQLAAALAVQKGSVRSRLWSALRGLSFTVCGFLCVALPLLLFLWHSGALPHLQYQCFTFVREHYRGGRALPFPGLTREHWEQTALLLPLIIPPCTLAYLGWLYTKRRLDLLSLRAGYLLPLSLLSLLYAIKGSVRVDFSQMLPANVAVLLILGVLVDDPLLGSFRRRSAIIALAFACLCCFRVWLTSLRTAQHRKTLVLQRLLRGSSPEETAWCATPSPMTRGFCFSMDSDHGVVVQYLLEHTQPGSALYVGLPRHDIVYAGDNLTYFAAGAVPAVKWSDFEPNLQTRADIQEQMIASIDAASPPYVVETAAFASSHEPNDSSVSSRTFLLDGYLQQHYRPMGTYGALTLLQRK